MTIPLISKMSLYRAGGPRESGPRAEADPPPGQDGFTLLEVLLSFFILALVLTGIWAAYRGTISLTEGENTRGRTLRMARAGLDLLGRDIMALAPFRGKVHFKVVRGMREGNDIATLSFSISGRGHIWEGGAAGGMTMVRYQVIENREGQSLLIRETQPLPLADNEQGQAFVVGEGVEALYIRLYDEKGKMYEEWESIPAKEGDKVRLPRLVELEILFKEGKGRDPRRFMTTFYLPLAEQTW